MRKPFRSVKEAVMLFGEKVLAGEIYANKLNEMETKTRENGQYQSKLRAVTAELEETKQSLQKAKEEGTIMAFCLQSLKKDLEQTKRELQQLKARESYKEPDDPEIEELKFIENTSRVVVKPQTEDSFDYQFQKKRSVKFASPSSLEKLITSRDVDVNMVETHPSLEKKMKRKTLIPLIGGLFLKKKGGQGQENDSPRV
ncbi:unnamed protein product [Ilex paraguariensis]|uniref:WEB family protein n=1 Tax=Ilex paraguariensis TaxID=185542 RepID=A0ABC8RRN7_9AQUA